MADQPITGNPAYPELIGADLDGTLTTGRLSHVQLCISGRTWAEYDDVAKSVARMMPIYIRGTGVYGDRQDAGRFKAALITLLGVTIYYEDDPIQAGIIRLECPRCEVRSP